MNVFSLTLSKKSFKPVNVDANVFIFSFRPHKALNLQILCDY